MRLAIIAAAIALSGCATAVNDSLDRRGVNPGDILAERVADARDDASRAKTAFAVAAMRLEQIEGLDGVALARQLGLAKAAGQDAAVATQELRLSVNTVNAAGARYFAWREEELNLIKTNAELFEARAAALETTKLKHRDFTNAYDAAKLRISPALSVYNSEVAALRRNATSRLAVEARAFERAAAISGTQEASERLDALVSAADNLHQTVK